MIGIVFLLFKTGVAEASGRGWAAVRSSLFVPCRGTSGYDGEGPFPAPAWTAESHVPETSGFASRVSALGDGDDKGSAAAPPWTAASRARNSAMLILSREPRTSPISDRSCSLTVEYILAESNPAPFTSKSQARSPVFHGVRERRRGAEGAFRLRIRRCCRFVGPCLA